MRRFLIKVFLLAACIVLLPYPNDAADGASKRRERKTRTERTQKRVRRTRENRTLEEKPPPEQVSEKKEPVRREFRTLEENLSPEQVNEKIAAIRRRIVDDPQMIQQHKQILLEVFNDVAQTQMGRWIFEKAHPNLNFTVKKLGAGYSGVYGSRSKTITLSEKIFDRIINAKDSYDRIDKKLWLAHAIAHESTHSIQGANKMNHPQGISFFEQVTINKVYELHSLLNENIVRFQVSNLPKYRKDFQSGRVRIVPMHMFYRDLREAKLEEGVSEEEADRFARTKFFETFWSNHGGTPILVGNKKIMPPGGVMINWNTTYNLNAFRGRCLEKNANIDYSMKDRGIEQELKRFTDVMKIDTKPSFFTDPETTSFEMPSSKRLIGYMDGLKKTEMDALAIGYIIKVYKDEKLWKIVIDSRNVKAASQPSHTETFEGTGTTRATYTCSGGKMNGIYREFDMQGNQILELPVKDNSVQGKGWVLEDGVRIPQKFSGGFVQEKMTSPGPQSSDAPEDQVE